MHIIDLNKTKFIHENISDIDEYATVAISAILPRETSRIHNK